MTQKAQILTVLEAGPVTTSQVSARTGLPAKHCCAILRYLVEAQVVSRKPHRMHGQRPIFLWSLAQP